MTAPIPYRCYSLAAVAAADGMPVILLNGAQWAASGEAARAQFLALANRDLPPGYAVARLACDEVPPAPANGAAALKPVREREGAGDER